MGGDGDLFGDGENPSLEHADGAFGDSFDGAAGARARQRDLRNKVRKRKGLPPEPEEPEKRGPGRPKGAMNRKTKDFEKLYAAMGFKDPLLVLGRFITMDPLDLQAWLVENELAEVALGKKTQPALAQLIDILKEQHRAAAELAPYLHGKKPVELQIIDERLPALIIDLGTDQLERGRQLADAQVLSIGGPEPESDINEINDLSDDED